VFRTIFAQPDAATVASTCDEVRDQLTVRFPRIGDLMDGAKAELLAFTLLSSWRYPASRTLTSDAAAPVVKRWRSVNPHGRRVRCAGSRAMACAVMQMMPLQQRCVAASAGQNAQLTL
jgi:hypothetical protein